MHSLHVECNNYAFDPAPCDKNVAQHQTQASTTKLVLFLDQNFYAHQAKSSLGTRLICDHPYNYTIFVSMLCLLALCYSCFFLFSFFFFFGFV